MNIGIVGLGLIGGSLARALKARTGHRVLGEDRDPGVLSRALAEGSIDGPLEPEGPGACSLVIVALYPGQTVRYIREQGPRFQKGGVVMDCCGVKRAVMGPAQAAARRHGFLFIGAHPMAGLERSGYAASRADLFEGASLILTPPRRTPAEAVEAVSRLAARIGFSVIRRAGAARHDRMIAYTSQLAHAVSCAYIRSPLAGKTAGFSAGSFADMTRVARLNEAMWAELFLDNADRLCEELEGLRERLGALSAAVRAGDREGLMAMLAEGRRIKERLDGP